MTVWEERTTAASEELMVAEHEARYRFVRPLVESAGTWCDLGCGTAVGSARALGDVLPPHVLLVDISEDALVSASLALPQAATSHIDLTSGEALARLRRDLEEMPSPVVITCFEVVEHLLDLTPLVGFFAGLIDAGADLCLSVPNDGFTGVDNPFHVTAWSPDSLTELESLLPGEPVRAAQVSLSGSMVVVDPALDEVEPPRRPAAAESTLPPAQQLLLYSEREVAPMPNVVLSVTDVVAARAWERQREADLMFFRSETERLTRRIAEIEGSSGR